MAVSRARQTESRIREHFSHIQTPHFRWFPPLRMAQKHRYKRVLPTECPFSRILGDFGLCVSTKKGSKRAQNGSKMTFSKNDTGPFGVFVEVFSARSEPFGPPSCGMFHLPTMCISNNAFLSKGGQWGQIVFYQKPRSTSPSARSYAFLIRVRVTELKYVVL